MKYISLLLLLLCGCGNAWAAATTTTNPVIFSPANMAQYSAAPLLRFVYNISQNNVNANSMNMGPSGFPTTSFGQQMVVTFGYGHVSSHWNNNHSNFVVPWTGPWWVTIEAFTANLNGGSGEWNNIQGELYQNGNSFCALNVSMPGGGSDGNGGGYTYYNATNCNSGNPSTLTKGDQMTMSWWVNSSGTGPFVGVINGTVTIQNFKDW